MYALRLLAEHFPRLVADSERAGRARRASGVLARPGVCVAIVVAQALLAYRSHQDEVEEELEWYEQEIPRLRADLIRWAEYEQAAAQDDGRD